MGFSGGGSNILKPHTHDGNIAQDGGALDMDGVTQGSLTAGDLIYSDGSNLQRLAIGGSGQSLTSSGSAPQWSAAGGAVMELVDFTQLGSDSTEINTSFTSIPMTDISELFITYNADIATASGISIRIQVNGITTSTYDSQSFTVVSASGTARGLTGADNWQISHDTLGNRRMGFVHLVAAPTAMSSNETIAATGQSMGQLGNFNWSGYNSTTSINAIDQVRLYITGAAGNQLKAGSNMGIYKINNS
jgi:hypothetical protein